MERIGARAVGDDVLPPLVEHMAVRVGKAKGDIDSNLRVRGSKPHAGVGHRAARTVGIFNLRVKEGAFLEIQRATRVERKAVGRVVRVGGSRHREDPLFYIGPVVAIGIFEEQNRRPLRQQSRRHSRTQSRLDCEGPGERGALVGMAVAIGVFKNQQFVVHRFGRLPMRVGTPDAPPTAGPGVERHLDGIDELGKVSSDAKSRPSFRRQRSSS